jgi:hypothetical protein
MKVVGPTCGDSCDSALDGVAENPYHRGHRGAQETPNHFLRGLAHPSPTHLESSVHFIFIEEPDRDSALYPA